MIDLNLLRDNPQQTIELIKKKDPSFDAELLLAEDEKIRSLRTSVESLRHRKNELAKKAQSGITPEIRSESIEVGKKLKESEHELQEREKVFMQFYLQCPNIPNPELPVGGKEANLIIKQEGKKPLIPFPIKNHVELGTALGWFDFHAASIMTGSNFALYKGEAVKLIYALTMFMLKHNQEHGYNFVLPPYIVNEKSLEIASNFPKFRDEVYEIKDDKLFLIPTAEVNLANLYRDHIFSAEELPMRMTAWTSCFRREAGSYGATERGLIRIHQFEKVELYTYCEPEESEKELDRMVYCAEQLLQKLGLAYRISLLATQDCSFPSAKTFDLEVWMPGQDRFMEVSSCSNCTDFQSRRGGMRYRKTVAAKPNLVHTLNGSSLALPRLMVALMETYQQEDGTIRLPSILEDYGIR